MSDNQHNAVAQEVNHNELKTITKRNYEVNQPLMIWGTTGIGKSQTVKETAQEVANDQYEDREFVQWNELNREQKNNVVENAGDYFVLYDIRLAEYEPSDIKGIPDLGKEDSVEWKPPLWVNSTSKPESAGFIFLDECNLAPASVQAAFYQLILDKQVGEVSINKDVYPVGAGNRAVDKANVYEMAAPLRNRFNHVQLEIPTAGRDGDWTSYAINQDLNDLVIGYLASPVGDDKLFTFNDNKDSKAFATPRKWEDVAQAIDGLDINQDLELIQKLVSSAVGRGIGTDFRAFLKVRQRVDLDKFLENPEEVKELETEDISLKHSIMTGIAAEYKNNTDVLPQLVKIATYLDEEFGILLLRLAKQYNEEHLTQNISDIEEFKQLSQDYSKYLLN